LPAAKVIAQSSKLKAIACGKARKLKGIKDGFKFYVLSFRFYERKLLPFLGVLGGLSEASERE
jgi:hypothetical protein